jgi:2-polyprenyl-6-hydroxyphenyl methylase/3-demethylubiquinone-9 3-methyltransferase
MNIAEPEYRYHDAAPTWANTYLWPVVQREVMDLKRPEGVTRVFDLGCGNGATAGMLAQMGFEVTGVDSSETGIAFAKSEFPRCSFAVASAYDDLAGRFGRFPLLVSLEVVEHLYDPRAFARAAYDLLEAGGTAIISTPYHGYLKNVALALSGKLDGHFTALWDGGHIKFFSVPTLGRLLTEAGFSDVRFLRVGRIPALAKSMVAIARKA